MNHLESSFTGRNRLWRYVVMFAAVLVAYKHLGCNAITHWICG